MPLLKQNSLMFRQVKNCTQSDLLGYLCDVKCTRKTEFNGAQLHLVDLHGFVLRTPKFVWVLRMWVNTTGYLRTSTCLTSMDKFKCQKRFSYSLNRTPTTQNLKFIFLSFRPGCPVLNLIYFPFLGREVSPSEVTESEENVCVGGVKRPRHKLKN